MRGVAVTLALTVASLGQVQPARATTPVGGPGVGSVRRTTSTVYCLTGGTYGGTRTHGGQVRTVAVNLRNGEWQRYRFTEWVVMDGVHTGQKFRVEDAGPKAHFDMWYADRRDCIGHARTYGGQTIRVRRTK